MSARLVFLILPDERIGDGFRYMRQAMLHCFAKGEAPMAFALRGV